jgi:hypothetical protein
MREKIFHHRVSFAGMRFSGLEIPIARSGGSSRKPWPRRSRTCTESHYPSVFSYKEVILLVDSAI